MINVLYHDKYIAVVEKPAGILSEGEGANCLPTLLREELTALGYTAPDPLTVHRLDKETRGIMVYALKSESASRLCAAITQGRWEKTYIARLWGVPAEPSGRLCDLLYYDRARGKSFVVDRQRKGVKEAVLDYETVSVYPDRTTSTVRVSLLTGRTHQIRVQFASRGLPLCGDRRYGAPAESGKELCLCAVSLSFDHPRSGERMSFEIEEAFE